MADLRTQQLPAAQGLALTDVVPVAKPFYAEATITAATQANPVVITLDDPGIISDGDQVLLEGVGGMVELEGRYFTLADIGSNQFQLVGEDGTGHTAFTSGGTAIYGTLAIAPVSALATLFGTTLPRGYIDGFETAVEGESSVFTDVRIYPGECRSLDDTADIAVSESFAKDIFQGFTEGDGEGGFFDYSLGGYDNYASVDPDTWYFLFLIEKDADGTIDAGFDDNLDASHCPDGWTVRRMICPVLTDGNSNVRKYRQMGNRIVWLEGNREEQAATSGTQTLLEYDLGYIPPGCTKSYEVILKVDDEGSAGVDLFVSADHASALTARVPNISVPASGSAVAQLRISRTLVGGETLRLHTMGPAQVPSANGTDADFSARAFVTEFEFERGENKR